MKHIRRLGTACALWLAAVAGAHIASQPAHGVIWRNLSPALWLFQGVPLEAGFIPSAIVSMQQVSITLNGGTAMSGQAVLSPALHVNTSGNVDAAVLVWQGIASADSSAHITYDDFAIGTIADATHVTATKPGAGTYALVWTGVVIDYYPQFVKSRNCGTITIGDGASSASTSSFSAAVDKTLPFLTGWTNGITGSSGQMLHVVATVQQTGTPHTTSSVFTASRAGTAISGTSLTAGYCYAEGR